MAISFRAGAILALVLFPLSIQASPCSIVLHQLKVGDVIVLTGRTRTRVLAGKVRSAVVTQVIDDKVTMVPSEDIQQLRSATPDDPLALPVPATVTLKGRYLSVTRLGRVQLAWQQPQSPKLAERGSLLGDFENLRPGMLVQAGSGAMWFIAAVKRLDNHIDSSNEHPSWQISYRGVQKNADSRFAVSDEQTLVVTAPVDNDSQLRLLGSAGSDYNLRRLGRGAPALKPGENFECGDIFRIGQQDFLVTGAHLDFDADQDGGVSQLTLASVMSDVVLRLKPRRKYLFTPAREVTILQNLSTGRLSRITGELVAGSIHYLGRVRVASVYDGMKVKNLLEGDLLNGPQLPRPVPIPFIFGFEENEVLAP